MPIIALHGAGVDHRDVESALEDVLPREGYRRIYPDLPGMGHSKADGLSSNSDVVDLLIDFIGEVAGEPALLIGHSYGSYLAQGVVARRPELVQGLALLCPMGERSGSNPEQIAVREDAAAYGELEPEQREGFDEYFVVRTAATARRYREHVAPGVRLADAEALGRIFSEWSIDLSATAFAGATLLLAGRRDATAGYAEATGLLDRYPHATLTVVEDAGHALMHERPALLGAMLANWLDRAAVGDGR